MTFTKLPKAISAEELLSTAQSRRDSTRAEIKLKRALNRINVKNAHNL